MAKNDTNIYGMNVQGSDATPEQFGHFFRDAFAGSVTGMAVAQNGTPNMSVTVARGTALLTKNTFTSVIAEVKADTTVAISTANTSNPRIDAIIAYEDTSYTWTSGTYIVDGLQRFKLASVVGTAAASPTAPSDATIQSEIGAGKPWTRLADVTVAANTTTIINSNVTSKRDMLRSQLTMEAVYPVGAIYISTVSTSPATLFGFGTWVAYAAGRVIVGKAASGTFVTAGATGGAETHTLTIPEMPAHTHAIAGLGAVVSNSGNLASGGNPPVASPTATTSAGGGGAHNNLQPYIVAYMWERVS